MLYWEMHEKAELEEATRMFLRERKSAKPRICDNYGVMMAVSVSACLFVYFFVVLRKKVDFFLS